jgi:anaerobic selenocysteine-containing dehydrogenase
LVTRRDFLKLASMGAAAAGTALVGLQHIRPAASLAAAGPRVVATLCTECPAGCALNLSLAGDRLLDVHANPGHPLACSGPCAGVETAIRRLESSARLPGPLCRAEGRVGGFQPMSWSAAAGLVGDILATYRSGEIAFLLGDTPDHLSDLVQRLALALGGAPVLRFTPASLLDGRITLQDAAQRLFGLPRLPYFDLQNSDLVYSFGASGDEPWLARHARPPDRPAAQTWVHFAPIRPPLAPAEDQWVSICPGSEALLAQALGGLVARIKGGFGGEQTRPALLEAASQASTLSLEDLHALARRFSGAQSALAVPGAGCLGQSVGLAAAQAVLALNVAAENLGRSGGVYLAPQTPLYPELNGRTATLAELEFLLRRMEAGQIKALFIHNVDLIAGLPAGLDAAGALEKVERVVSFSSVYNETSQYAGALLPDHLPLESWGYQRLSPAADRPLVSTIQPAFAPRFNTRSTADLLLEAARRLGGKLAASLPYRDEQAFVRQAVAGLPWGGGADPWAQWLAQGGWWPEQPGLLPPVCLRPTDRLRRHISAPWALDPLGAEFYLHFAESLTGLAGLFTLPSGLRPIAMNPAAVQRLGLRSGDAVRLASPAGELEAVIVEMPEIRPDMLVITLQRGHTKGYDPMDLVRGEQNESGDLAYQSTWVRILPFV